MNQIIIDTNARSRPVPSRRAAQKETTEIRKPGLALPVRILLVSLFIPWIWHIGPIALSSSRIVLVVMAIPCLVRWASGKAGPVRPADIALLLYCFWSSISLMVNQGVDGAIQPAGVLVSETIGAYFLARCYIRDADSFRSAIRLLFLIVVVMLPFAIMEAVLKRDVLLDLFGIVLPVPVTAGYEPRWGLKRVQGVLEHPILFGVVCGSILALTHVVLGYGESFAKRWSKTLLVAFTAFMSLSAGPMTAMIGQAMLLLYNWVLRDFAYRWRLLLGAIAAMWTAVSMVSNRSLPNLYLSTFAFDAESAYYRLQIWTFGSQSALNHPFFGVGLNRWERPNWMPPSIDMFWMLHAVYYGIPAAMFMLFTFLLTVFQIGLAKSADGRIERWKTGYLVTMCGFFVVGWTVHFWNATYALFLFLLASGYWMMDAKPEEPRRSSGNLPGTRSPSRRPRTSPSEADGRVVENAREPRKTRAPASRAP